MGEGLLREWVDGMIRGERERPTRWERRRALLGRGALRVAARGSGIGANTYVYRT